MQEIRAEQFNDRSAEVSGILGEYHRLFDIYHEYSGVNNLCTVNRLAGGEAVKVDKKLIDFMLYAKELCEATNGEMDVTMAPCCLFGTTAARRRAMTPRPPRFRHWRSLRPPRSTPASVCLRSTRKTALSGSQTPKLRSTSAHLARATRRSARRNISNPSARRATCSTSAETSASSAQSPTAAGWNTGIRDPQDPDGSFAVSLDLSDTACVTSGTYERYYMVDGEKYHHIIDKDTLYPADYFESLTVVTKDSGLADALSTALFCMSYEDGLALAEKLGVDVLWIFPDGGIRYTSGLEARIVK